MINIEVNQYFETQREAFIINPIKNPSHYEGLMEEMCSEILSPNDVFNIKSQLNQSGYVLVTSDLKDYAPPTPTSLNESYDGPYYGEAMLALIGQVVGNIQSLSHQNNGRWFHDVMPVKTYKEQQTSASSAVTLEMHTEISFVDNPPEYLMLCCVRQDQEGVAETHLYDSKFALSTLSSQQFNQLTKPNYRFRLDANATGDVEETEKLVSIFDQTTMRLLRFDFDTCDPIGQDSIEAFDALMKALLDVRISVRLKPGQVILIDNKRMVHSRSKFKANYDGNDRWLKRALLRGK